MTEQPRDNVIPFDPPAWLNDAPEWAEMPDWAEPAEPTPEPAIENRWPEPVDLWAKYEEPKLPANLLPDVIERYARRQAAVMGADPAGMAMAALVNRCIQNVARLPYAAKAQAIGKAA